MKLPRGVSGEELAKALGWDSSTMGRGRLAEGEV